MRYSWTVIAIVLAFGGRASDAQARLDLYVDKSTQRIAVVQDGYMRYIWPVSTGRDGYATPNGVYVPERLERSWFSREYYNAPMPYAIFFHNGYAIHGSYDLNRLGGPASHGCIRLYPQHAAILFAMVEQEGPENTTIVVGDGGSMPRAPRFRDMDELVRSVVPADGNKGLLQPRTVPSREGIEPLEPPIDPSSQFATWGREPRGDPDRGAEMPRSGTIPFGARNAYRAREPRNEQNHDIERNLETPVRQGDNNTILAMPAVPVVPTVVPRRDTDTAKEVARIARSQPDESAGARLNPSANAPARAGDNVVQAAAPVAPPLPPTRHDTENAKEAPRMVRSEPDESASGRSSGGASRSEPTGPGYKVLPKSYWTGASWRWRSNGEPDVR